MVIARSSNLLGKITVLVMVSFVVNTALALDGSGTQEDPWRIKSLEDFNDFAADANYWAGFTRLETDVNLAGMVYERAVIAWDVNNFDSWFDGTSFTGIFDGYGYKILNLTIDDGGAGNDFLGLFGKIYQGEVRNLGLEGGSVTGEENVCGLAGENYEGSVSDCYSTVDVSGNDYVGGLVGANLGSISDCYSTGDVSGDVFLGGLVGISLGSISDGYSTGDVNGVNIVGGLVGENSSPGEVWYCYSTGDISGEVYVGGLVGWNYGEIVFSLWNTATQTHGVTESFGYNFGTATNVVGLPTHQLQQQSTFTDWDFINVWNIGENQTYPYLRIYLAGDINKDGIVNFLDVAITANKWMEGVE